MSGDDDVPLAPVSIKVWLQTQDLEIREMPLEEIHKVSSLITEKNVLEKMLQTKDDLCSKKDHKDTYYWINQKTKKGYVMYKTLTNAKCAMPRNYFFYND